MENDEFEHYREPESQAYLDFKSKGMELNEIKKLLYKEKPIARLTGRNKTDRLYVAKITTGDEVFNNEFFYFIVPEKEIKDAEKIAAPGRENPFPDEMPAQLLIRYIVTDDKNR